MEKTKNCEKINQIVKDGECIPGENTKVIGNGQKSEDEKGYTCSFEGELKTSGGGLVSQYHSPEGTIEITCVPDPNLTEEEKNLNSAKNTWEQIIGIEVTPYMLDTLSSEQLNDYMKIKIENYILSLAETIEKDIKTTMHYLEDAIKDEADKNGDGVLSDEEIMDFNMYYVDEYVFQFNALDEVYKIYGESFSIY